MAQFNDFMARIGLTALSDYNGWPYSVVRQQASMIGKHGKVKQTVVSLDSYSFGQ